MFLEKMNIVKEIDSYILWVGMALLILYFILNVANFDCSDCKEN